MTGAQLADSLRLLLSFEEVWQIISFWCEKTKKAFTSGGNHGHPVRDYFIVSMKGKNLARPHTVKLDTLGTFTSVCLIQGVPSKQVLIYCAITVNY